MTKFDTETVKMVADALGCSVPTAAARREAAEMLLSLVAERDAALAEVERLRKTLGE